VSALLDIKAMGNSAKVSYLLIIGEARLGYSSAMVDSTTPLQTTISRSHNFSSKYLDWIFSIV